MDSLRQMKASGEQVVIEFLEKQGFSILERNYRTPIGKVDLIVQRGDFLAFVEVKTRRRDSFSTCSVVNRSKQTKIMRAAKLFLVDNEINVNKKVCRFDVATVLLGSDGKHHIDYIENAFSGT